MGHPALALRNSRVTARLRVMRRAVRQVLGLADVAAVNRRAAV